jgi:hypothetical protein
MDAGDANAMTASARASVILVDMDLFLLSKQIAFADQIVRGAVLFPCIETGSARIATALC